MHALIYKLSGFLLLPTVLLIAYGLLNFDLYFTLKQQTRDYYDYIIVGAGTAGCVLANKLTENEDVQVLLVEAGDQFGMLSTIPLASPSLQGSPVDWSFKTVPQIYSSKGLRNKIQMWPRGKGLGGSHQMNYMLHFTGEKIDYDNWQHEGAVNWGYTKMAKYFQNYQPYSFRNSVRIDKLHITKTVQSSLTEVFLQACHFVKTKFDEHIQLKATEHTIKKGIRWSVYHAYLRPALKRKNLSVLLNSHVKKLVIRDGRVDSILISSLGFSELRRISAKREVLLCAGALQTPQILLLSGIGPRKELNKLSIPVQHNSPRVGKNLFDHLNLPIYVSADTQASITESKLLQFHTWYEFIISGRGSLASMAVTGLAGRVKNHSAVAIIELGSVNEMAMRDIANYRQHVFRSFFPHYWNQKQEGFVLLNTCFHPHSRGSITLKSRSFRDQPYINPNYLKDAHDIRCMIDAVRLSSQIVNTAEFKKLNASICWPKVKECSNFGPHPEDFMFNRPTDHYIECITRYGAMTAYHPGGTCSIGNTTDSVVDNELRVNGIDGLRIVDGSVLPGPISGTPNSVIVALAERAADLIKSSKSTL